MKLTTLLILGGTLLCAVPSFAQDVELANLPSADGVRFVGNNPNSFPSQTLMPAGDVNGDGYGDLLFGSPLQNPDSSAYVAFGKAPLNADVSLPSFANSASTSGFRMYAPDKDIGFEISPAGDFNNDGYDDVLIMSWNGVTYLVYGHASPFTNINLAQPSSAFVKFTGAGKAGAGIGDFNNDGFDDIVLGSDTYTPVWNLPNSGRIWVIFGRNNLAGEVNLADFQTSDENGFTVTGRINGDFGGSIYPLGDFNGDGYSDFAVANSLGRVTLGRHTRLLFLGKSQGFREIDFNVNPDKTIFPEGCISLQGNVPQSYAAGCATGLSKDFNGDGRSDLLINNYIVFGRDDNTTTILLSDITSTSTQGLKILSPPGENVGNGYAWAGDSNNDGFSDVVLTDRDSAHNGINNAGTAYVLWGGNDIAGVFDLSDFVSGEDGFKVFGEMRNPDSFVFPTAPAGDVDGDNYDDFMLAITGYDTSISNSYGYNYLVRGRPGPASVRDWQLWEK